MPGSSSPTRVSPELVVLPSGARAVAPSFQAGQACSLASSSRQCGCPRLRRPSLAGPPPAEFHNRPLSEQANLQAEYVLWRQNKDPTALCSLCQVGRVEGGLAPHLSSCACPCKLLSPRHHPTRCWSVFFDLSRRKVSVMPLFQPPQMPYLLTPEAKSRIIQGEAAMEQQQHLSAAAMQVRRCLPEASRCRGMGLSSRPVGCRLE